ncbi:MAG: hypothetical protein ABIR55_03030, partial [Burkholderiaceae bacterium]
NVTDLGPFLRWMPNPDMPVPQSVPRGPAVRAASGSGVERASAARGTVTVSITVVDDCGCMVLPWDPCQHS